MARNGEGYKNPISILYFYDGRNNPQDCEFYFWYAGNPFGLATEQDAVVAIDGQIYQTQPLQVHAKEIVRTMYERSPAIGHLVARKDFMVVRIPSSEGSRISSELLNFFPSGKSIVKRVKDRRQKIARKGDIKRMDLVVEAERKFVAGRHLENIQLHIPDERSN